ncbi:MAG: TolC family protein [Bacteroidota bacterium]
MSLTYLKLSLLAYGSLLTATLTGQTQSLSLSDAIQLGLENNYGIRIAQAELEAVANNDDWALAGRYPTISLGLSPSIAYRNNTNPASIVSSSSTASFGVAPSANLNWTLFNGGRVRLTKEQLTTLTTLSEGQLQLQVENTVQSIIQAYYNAVVQREQIEVLQRILNLSRDQIDYQDLRQEYGQAGSFEMLQARDAFLNDSISLEIQRTNYDNAVRNLLQLISQEEGPSLTLTTAFSEEQTVYSREELLSRLESGNRSLDNLRINRQLAALDTRLIETERQPNLGLSAGVGYDITVQTGTQTFDFGGDQPPRDQSLPGIASRTLTGNLGLTASYLIYDGGARNVRRQSARLREVTSQLNYESAAQELRILLVNTLALYENQRDIVDLTQELIVNAERNLAIAEERFRGGIINSFDYRSVQLAYLNAEFQLLQAQLNLKNTETELLRLTGQIVN